MTDSTIFMTIFGAATFAFLPAIIAYKKGHDFILWYVYGLVLSVIALFHAWRIAPDPHKIQSRNPHHKTEMIQQNVLSLLSLLLILVYIGFYILSRTTQ
jgi:hypothetical protein